MTCLKKHARWKDISVTVARQQNAGRKVRILVCADNHHKKDRTYFVVFIDVDSVVTNS
jgi:hypothetical protein